MLIHNQNYVKRMEITLEAKQILGLIINIQLGSYTRILNDDLDQDDWFLLQFQATGEDVKTLVRERISLYSDLKSEPQLLSLVDDIEIMVMRHILFRMEDLWMKFNSQGVSDLWKIFFDIEELRNPRVKQATKFLKLHRNG